MIFYYDADGTLIHRSKNLTDMVRFTGLSKRQILSRMGHRETYKSRVGSSKALIPYFERDEYDDSTKDGVNRHFLKLYFQDMSPEQIRQEMDITDKKLYSLYRELIGINIEPARKDEKRDKFVIPADFWDEWESAVSVLFKSGKRLDIPITFK